MRLRSGHILIIVIGLLGGLVLAMLRLGGAADTGSVAEDAPLPPEGVSLNESPMIAVETLDYDIGEIPNDQTGRGVIQIANHGTRPLVISEIRTSCACTQGTFDVKEPKIAPGASAPLMVEVFPKRIYGFQSSKVLTIFSNDPAHPSVEIKVRARITPEFRLTPDTFDFGKVEKGQEARLESRFQALQDSPVKITGLSAEVPNAKNNEEKTAPPPSITLEEIPIPEAEWEKAGRPESRIIARLNTSLSPGKFTFPIYVATDAPRFPYLRVNVTGEIIAPYTIAYPNNVKNIVIKPNGETVSLTVSAPTSVKAGNISVTAGKVIASVEESNAQSFQLKLRAAENLPLGRYDDVVRMTIELEGNHFEEFIPVKVFVITANHAEEEKKPAEASAAIDDGA